MNNKPEMNTNSEMNMKLLTTEERLAARSSIKRAGLTPTSWARVNDLAVPTVLGTLNGYFQPVGLESARTYQKVVSLLRRDGHLPGEAPFNETPNAA